MTSASGNYIDSHECGLITKRKIKLYVLGRKNHDNLLGTYLIFHYHYFQYFDVPCTLSGRQEETLMVV